MNRTLKMMGALLVLLLLLPGGTGASEWWIVGTVKGEKINRKTIEVHLVRVDDPRGTPVSKTSVNTRGQYAFSDPGEGLPPRAYKVVLNVAADLSIDISLENVKPRGWMPTVIPPVTVYW